MAGVVESVLTDKELDILLGWGALIDTSDNYGLTKSEECLYQKLEGWRRSLDCGAEKCATGYCRNQPACPSGKCSPPTPGFPAPDVGRKRESCGYTCAQLRGRDDV